MADSIVLITSQTVGNINAAHRSDRHGHHVADHHGDRPGGAAPDGVPGHVEPAGVAVAYQWFAGGTSIPGAVAATYVPTILDYGKNLQVRVTASYPGWFPGSATSPVDREGRRRRRHGPAQADPDAGQAGDQGHARGGRTRSASHEVTGEPDKVSLAYQWYAGSKKIKKATKRTLVLTTKQVGKKLTVKVTASRAGYVPLTVRTKPSAKVKP